jgi:hypothetical protein
MMDEVDESLELTPPSGGKSAGGNSAGGGAGGGGAGGGNEDLSKELSRTLKREPLEQITCRRVGDHHYRCNWWTPQDTTAFDNPSMLGSLVTTSRISKSQFVHATRTGGKLTVKVMTR